MAVDQTYLNRLLALLRVQDQDRLRPHLEPVTLEYKRPLYGAYEPIEFVYFIEEGVASLVNNLTNGDAVRSQKGLDRVGLRLTQDQRNIVRGLLRLD